MKKYLYAIIAGVVIVLYHFIVFAVMGDISKLSPVQWQTLEILGFARYIILILGVTFSIRSYRNSNPDKTSFKALFIVGLAAATIVAHFVGLMEFGWVLAHPNFFDEYMKAQTLQMQQSGMSPEKMQQMRIATEQTKFLQTPLMNGIFYFVETLMIGTIASVASAAVMKKRMNSIQVETQ